MPPSRTRPADLAISRLQTEDDARARPRGVCGRDETGLAGFLILCMTGAFVGYTRTNLDARRLYERLGYKVVGEFTDSIVRGHPELLLRKTLGPLTGFSSKATAGRTSQGTG